MKKDKKITCLLSATICLTLIACILYPTRSLKNASVTSETAKLVANVDSTKNILYLSDLDYITDNNWSYNGWNGHSIQKDKNQDGGAIGLIINGETRTFPKGLSVHAKGQVTFDISEYSNKLTRFIAKIGLDASKKTNGSIWFQIYVSNDGSKWTSLLKTGTMTGTTEAVDVDLNVEGYKYLRIYVDPVGDISSDHGSIMNARLVTKDYESKDVFYDRVHKVEYYDEILKEHDTEFNYKNNYKLILEREFVNKLGYWSIQNLAEVTTEVTEAYDWILSENRVLEEIIEVGEISNGTAFLKVLTDLYNNYKDDLATENGYVYEKMMVGLAAAYSTDRIYSPLSFSFQSPTYDYVERFGIMKDLFDNNKFKRVKINALAGEFVVNDWFRNYHVELMRMVMQDGTNNGDLIWLNGFTNEKQSVNFHMINYVSPVYTQDKYYDEANKEKYNQQFYLTKYGVPYGLVNGTKIPRYWMVFANGGICWNASRVGQSMYRVNGIPATGAYQPGHELYIQYYEDSNGNGYWTPRYGNWGQAGSTWGGGNPYRYIFNWGGKYFTDKHISGSKGATSTGYLYLAQANLNRYTDYKKSLYYNLNANSYTDDEQKLSSYFKALEVNNINLDSYDAIITLYKKMSVKNEGGTITSNDWHALANKIIEAYTYYPVAMFDLLKIIRPYLDGSDRLDIDRLEKEALTKATNATADVTNSVDGTRTHARQLLGKTQPDPISFSFDGENGGKIVKNPTYQLAWGYSLDGGKTFTKYKTDDSVTLTTEELASITEENDIIINFMGLSYTFKIDITKGTLSNLLFANDLENRVVEIDLTYEWRNNEGDSWTSYKSASPDNTGNKTLYVRKGSTGRQLASDSITYTFTADNQVNTRKYIPVSHLSIESYSTQSVDSARPFYASNAIDGNGNTLWHTDFRENVLNNEVKPFITIKLDKPRYISAVEFKQLRYRTVDPHFIKNARVYVSEDGKNWTEAGKIENCPQDNELRNITFKESIYGEYVKIEMDTYDMFASLSLINIFHDTTKNPRPTAGIGYSITGPTTENVIARLVNVSVEKYEILSPGGNTHEFTDNGEFTFRFIDKDTGIEGTATAKVNWIDREAPTADIEYSSNKATNGTVIATLKPSEDIKVINNGYYQIDEDSKVYDKDGVLLDDYVVDEDGIVKDITGRVIDPLKYEFIDNGEFVFEFVDRAGNKGTAKAKVGFIDREIPIATIKYDVESLTNKNVTASITFNEENVIVTNNDGKTNCIFTKNGEFRFDFQDVAGNNGTIIAKVDWIDKEAPTAELKYEKYNNKVIVEVVNPSKEITFKEGNGVYEYTKSGNYEIVFYDLLGNVGKLVAKIELPKEEIKNENKPNNPDVSKPSIPEDNSQINSDKPTTDQSGINPDDNNKPNDNNTNNNYNENNSINNSNNTNYSNSNNSINDNYNISNNNNENRNDNSTKENLDNTIDGENRDKLNTNSNTIKEENNVTYAKEQKVGMSKVILGGVITAIFLLALCLYIIKIIVKK